MTPEQLERKREYNRRWAREAHYRNQQDAEYRAKKTAAAKAWREANPDRHRALQREWAKTPRARAAHKERSRVIRAQGRDWAHNHPEEVRAYKAAWESRNREHVRRLKADREARRRAARRTTEVEIIERLLVLEQHGALCGICGEPVDPDSFHLDHIIPLSRGGPHTYANVQPAHPLCNIRKGAAT